MVQLLHRHHIPIRPQGGTITQRFPEPTDISAVFLSQAYTDIGLSAEHIEHLTGQPAERILQLLHHHAIPVRPPGPRSPWLARRQPTN